MEITAQNLTENGWKQSDKSLKLRGAFNYYEMEVPTNMDRLTFKLKLVDMEDNTFLLSRSNSEVVGMDNLPKDTITFSGTLYSMAELETILQWTFYRDNKRINKPA